VARLRAGLGGCSGVAGEPNGPALDRGAGFAGPELQAMACANQGGHTAGASPPPAARLETPPPEARLRGGGRDSGRVEGPRKGSRRKAAQNGAQRTDRNGHKSNWGKP